jgi:hypothetical protein
MLVVMLVTMGMVVMVMMYSPRMSGWLMESSISVQALRTSACWNAVGAECPAADDVSQADFLVSGRGIRPVWSAE